MLGNMNDTDTTPQFKSALLLARQRAVRTLAPIKPDERRLMHLAGMLCRLDASIVELCTPGHRRGRGFTTGLLPIDLEPVGTAVCLSHPLTSESVG